MLLLRSGILAEAICTSIRIEFRSQLVFFFYLYTTIRQKYIILFHLFFLFAQPFDQKLGSTLIYFFYLHTTIRPKIRVYIDLFLLFVHDYSTKN